ncbi:hypothetical protein E9531_02545 [Lampropedia puyangensis]|uniref:Uncharacterized protein n=1 Tax=Lampropedia puyangensis TaxID=1330072 RepID=A0A4S8FF06_9BURK|nr:hypothetical protein [Lampropedia puyangensis]THU05435.1 hypothetical protein E9531_02545 [Lampropedia puyangensis]
MSEMSRLMRSHAASNGGVKRKQVCRLMVDTSAPALLFRGKWRKAAIVHETALAAGVMVWAFTVIAWLNKKSRSRGQCSFMAWATTEGDIGWKSVAHTMPPESLG